LKRVKSNIGCEIEFNQTVTNGVLRERHPTKFIGSRFAICGLVFVRHDALEQLLRSQFELVVGRVGVYSERLGVVVGSVALSMAGVVVYA
jgi:hypothetical protein